LKTRSVTWSENLHYFLIVLYDSYIHSRVPAETI